MIFLKSTNNMAHSHLLTFFALILVGLASTPLIGQNCAFSPCFDNDCGDLNVGFSPLGGPQFCEGQIITLINSSTPGFDFFVVDWRDGNVDTMSNYDEFQHIYTIVDSLVCVGPSIRAFSLCFKGQKDCPDGLSCQSGTYDFGIIVRPEASFSVPSSVCVGNEFSFSNSSCNSDDFLWEFGDGQTSTETNPTHEYSEPGIYQVTLTAVNQCSSDDFTATIEVVEEPEAAFELDFDSDSGCVPAVVNFINHSNQWSQTQWSIHPNDTLLWVFTDTNMTFNWMDIEVLFMEPGEYLIELTASNACGEETLSDTLEIFEDLNIEGEPIDPFCEEVTLTPGDLGVVFGGSIDSVHWTFINGSYPSATVEHFPPVTFSESGEIILEVWGSCGDTSLNFFITIVTGEIVFGNNPEEICQNAGPIELIADPPGGEWSGPGITDPAMGIFDPSTLQGGNTYTLSYIFDISPCEIEDEIEISIIEPAIGSFSTPILCADSDPVTLEANPVGGEWSGPGIVNSQSGLFDPVLSGPGTFEITYEFTDGNGCVVEVVNELLVEDFPDISMADTLLLCVDDSEVNLNVLSDFQANPGGGISIWSGPGVVNSSGDFNSAGMNLEAGFIVIYVVYERNECVVEDSLVIELIDNVELELAFADTLICIAEGNLQLTAEPGGGSWSGPGVNSQTGTIDLNAA
nr:PKD domain-containing protein [Saprospiraceae bacterium]